MTNIRGDVLVLITERIKHSIWVSADDSDDPVDAYLNGRYKSIDYSVTERTVNGEEAEW